MSAPRLDLSFPYNWKAEILSSRPLILPRHHFTYPAKAEEVERGALEVLVRPRPQLALETGKGAGPFLATCALGFRDPAAPTGVWSMPHPDWLCAVSGGYAYLIDTSEPSRFVFLRQQPVLHVLAYLPGSEEFGAELLLFAGHYSVIAWGRDGEAWETEQLSWEGLSNLRMENGVLYGEGWDLVGDRDVPFRIDLRDGRRL